MTRRRKTRVLIALIVVIFAFPVMTGCPRKPAEPPRVVIQPTTQPPIKDDIQVKDVEPTTPKEDVETTTTTTSSTTPATPTATTTSTTTAPVKKLELGDIFFAFDKSDLTAESRSTLADNADKLMEDMDATIVIEGHCDERGTNEYNLGLGERRANSAKQYLVSLGVSRARIETISYGEEKPFARGHNEAAWKQNRRAHFVIK